MKTFLMFILSLCITFGMNAQTAVTQKIGYADGDYIISQLPEIKQVESELQTHATQLESQIKVKQQEFETKYKAWQALPATTPEAIRADKERELQSLQESGQKFQQEAETSMRDKSTKLMEPIYAKVGKAIEDVAKENGYDFIFAPGIAQGGGDILLYTNEKFDISDLVLKKLGVTPKPVVAPPAAGK